MTASRKATSLLGPMVFMYASPLTEDWIFTLASQSQPTLRSIINGEDTPTFQSGGSAEGWNNAASFEHRTKEKPQQPTTPQTWAGTKNGRTYRRITVTISNPSLCKSIPRAQGVLRFTHVAVTLGELSVNVDCCTPILEYKYNSTQSFWDWGGSPKASYENAAMTALKSGVDMTSIKKDLMDALNEQLKACFLNDETFS
ncbi:hypothetical protein B0T10DRAFT_458344 [Thelonectria olida]|uniref:Uncharacterized protein n=1 Tax=Thelonectria olida TaxID=1576542 RepID=A0A9P9ARX1_9HYPO|nr:hypothetical protein B0T10DRAFT_458344 [Thelonectria olida]